MKEGSDDTGGDIVHPWTTLEVEQVLDCRIFSVKRCRRASPVTGKVSEFTTISSPDWVNVVALTGEEDVVMIRQYRHGSDEVTLEIPGGIIDPDETPEEAARRELMEETGFEGGDAQIIGRVRPNPALFDNCAYTVLITGARRTAEPSPDEHEEVSVHLHRLNDVDRLLREGGITHTLVVNAFLWLRYHRGGRS